MAIRLYLALICVILCVASTGCIPMPATGQGAVEIRAAALGSTSLSGLTVVAKLTLAGLMIQRTLEFDGEYSSTTIESIPAGVWNLDVYAQDSDGDTIYSAKTSVQVRRDSVRQVSIMLKPLNGVVRIYVSSQGIPDAESIVSADILVYHSGGTTPYRSYTGLPAIGGQITVEDSGYLPRSYDMQVRFRDEAGDLVYSSEWVGFGILPGKTTEVFWNPGMGSLMIEIGIDYVPDAPRNVSVVIEGTQASVSWNPPIDLDVSTYRVFWRYSPFDRYMTSRSKQVDAAETSTVVSLSSAERGGRAYFVVTARDAAGNDSLRSDEVELDYP